MRVLIVGGGGMLGHKLWQALHGRFDTRVTLRSDFPYEKYGLFARDHAVTPVEVTDAASVRRALDATRPDVVINCAGIVKQLPAAHDPIPSIAVNALFPHQLASMCNGSGARTIHISTDCVFKGDRGNYVESDPSDAQDLYGRTKYLGEISGPGRLTLRTSIIGRELSATTGLVEWFLSNRGGKVRGFQRAIYSGLTTIALARLIAHVIEARPDLAGVYQVSSAPIDKYELLLLLNREYAAGVTVDKDRQFVIDRSLDSSRFRTETGWQPPEWADMIRELAQDPTPYDTWRAS